MSATVHHLFSPNQPHPVRANPAPSPTPPVVGRGENPEPPNGTELTVAHEFAMGWIKLRDYVRIIGVDDVERASFVLDAYQRGAR